ncbi:MAG TPA: hypothetical protein VJ826_00735 [Candidatus Polarisedimenticolaceae bacterium]|nr:hypothetical protein [Candidatus Polarisedimenticolaceae bacterium]
MTEGVVVDVQSIKENWNEYQLEDGTRLRMRLVVHQVLRLQEINDRGEPIYVIKSQNILDADVPPELKVRGNN